MATFNSAGEENYLNKYGSSFASLNGTSTKYATEYYNPSDSYNDDFTLGKVSMMGDAMQEIYLSDSEGWNQDYVDFVSTSYPFLTRGGVCNRTDEAGLFYSSSYFDYYYNITFRVVLVP